MKNNSIIGTHIRERRRALGMTQEQLAEKLFVSNKAVSKWETGESNPDTALLLKISEVLQISSDDLFGIEERKKISKSLYNSTLKFAVRITFLVILAVIFSVGFLFFLISTLLALDKSMVVSAVGDASMQWLIIVLISVLALVSLAVSVWLIVVIVKQCKKHESIRRAQAYVCWGDGYRCFSDLQKETQKQLLKEFRKKNIALFVLVICCLLLELIGFIIYAFGFETGHIIQIINRIFISTLLIVLLSKEKKFFLEKKIYM